MSDWGDLYTPAKYQQHHTALEQRDATVTKIVEAWEDGYREGLRYWEGQQ